MVGDHERSGRDLFPQLSHTLPLNVGDGKVGGMRFGYEEARVDRGRWWWRVGLGGGKVVLEKGPWGKEIPAFAALMMGGRALRHIGSDLAR